MTTSEFDACIRRVPNFPKPGVNFYDITSIIGNAEAFGFVIDTMCEWAQDMQADTILAVEARGFLFAAPVAVRMGIPLVLARKKGKLPGEVWCREYSLEYGSDTVCIHTTDLVQGSKVLLLDDLIATGGTFAATASIIENEAQSTVVGFAAVIGLPFLNYSSKIPQNKVRTIINYNAE